MDSAGSDVAHIKSPHSHSQIKWGTELYLEYKFIVRSRQGNFELTYYHKVGRNVIQIAQWWAPWTESSS